ncbi:MAG: SLC13 family permease [candidate division WOR-3 bacterium]
MAKRIGFVAGPLLFAVVLSLPIPGLPPHGRKVLALASWMAVWWMTEAVPIPATSLLPLALLPLMGVVKLTEAALAYADPVVFLFLGGFIIARGLEVYGLHERMAMPFLAMGRKRPWLVLFGFMLATAFVSMWMSNTATVMILLPIALAALSRIHNKRFGIALMLGLAYSASIGGTATLVGTPPNLVLAGQLPRLFPGAEIGFARWMGFALPFSLVLLGLAWLYLSLYFKVFRIRSEELAIPSEPKGPLTRSQIYVILVFVLVAFGWLTREGFFGVPGWENLLGLKGYLGDASVAIIGALALLGIPGSWKRMAPVLSWEKGSELPWGILILFGGGLSLASSFGSSGLSEWIARGVVSLRGLPAWLMVFIVAGAISLLTELTSNTAVAALVIPLLAGVSQGAGLSPYTLTVPAALASSCAFMLPVGTPPNAIVYGTGRFTIGQMVRVGFVVNLIAVLLTTALSVWVLPLVFR